MTLCITHFQLFPTKSVATEYLYSFLVPQSSVPKMLHEGLEGCMPGFQCHHKFGNWEAKSELQKSWLLFTAYHRPLHFSFKDLILPQTSYCLQWIFTPGWRPGVTL